MHSTTNSITINAPIEAVWQVLTHLAAVNEWMDDFVEGSSVEGDFRTDGTLDYTDPDNGGMRTTVKECSPNERLVIVNTAILKKDGAVMQDTDKNYADMKPWIGCSDTYELSEKDGKTALTVTTTMPDPEEAENFNEAWANALATIKELAEKE